MNMILFIVLTLNVTTGNSPDVNPAGKGGWWFDDIVNNFFKQWKTDKIWSAMGGYGYSSIKNSPDPGKWEFATDVGAGILLPQTKTYRIQPFNLWFDYKLSCKGINISANFSSIVDWEALKQQIYNFIKQPFILGLLILLQSNSQIGELAKSTFSWFNQLVGVLQTHCNYDDIVALSKDPTYRSMSFTQKMCVHAWLSYGANYQEALDRCTEQQFPSSFPSSGRKQQKCYEVVNLPPSIKEMMINLVGTFKDTATVNSNPYGCRGDSCIGDFSSVVYIPAEIDLDSVMSIFSSKADYYLNNIDNILDSGLSGNAKYDSITAIIRNYFPPGAITDPQMLIDLHYMDVAHKELVHGVLSHATGLLGARFLLDEAYRVIDRCRRQTDARIPEEAVAAYKERLRYLETQYQNVLKNSRALQEGAVKPLKHLADYIESNKRVGFIQILDNITRNIPPKKDVIWGGGYEMDPFH